MLGGDVEGCCEAGCLARDTADVDDTFRIRGGCFADFTSLDGVQKARDRELRRADGMCDVQV